MENLQNDILNQEILLSNQVKPIAINAMKEMIDITINTFRKPEFGV